MYFFDSYAIFEIINGNPAYHRFQDQIIITSVLNLGELYYGLLKQGSNKADVWFEQPDLIEIDPETMKQAMLFRHAHKKKKLSMVDCVGYMLAQKLRFKFLTGDEQFREFSNVEFVK
jgi:hypothetical protein